MSKFKKVKVNPLTDFESLQLKKASEKHFDATVLPSEKQKELLSELMKIVKQTEEAVVAKPIGGKPHVSVVLRASAQKKKTFSFAEPNPVHLYFQTAIGHLEQAETFKQQFLEVVNGHPQEEYETFCQFFKEIVQGAIFLLMTIEGFVNQLPEEGQTYNIQGEDKTKKDIEWMKFTEKLRYAIPVLTGSDFYTNNRPDYDRLHLLNTLRDDLIHLKKLELANFTYYENLFKRLLDFQSLEVSNTVYDFINSVKANFFEDENT